MNRNEIPNCCLNCKSLDWDIDEMRDTTFYYCKKGIKFPIKKLCCKKQILILAEVSNEK